MATKSATAKKKWHALITSILVLALVACSNEPDKPNNKEDIVTISTIEQLIEFADSVNNGNSFSGKTVVLGTDIMLNDTTNWKSWDNNTSLKSWTPIGKNWNCFAGTFEGAMYEISGLYINSTEDYQGLFGCLGPSTLIKNVKVNASYIKGGSKVGGIAGVGSGGTVLNSSFEGIIIGNSYVGGIVGLSDNYNYNKILNSYFIGVITANSSVGGIIGDNQGNVFNCYSIGEIKGITNTGGIVGSNWGTVTNNYSIGTVSVERYQCGGIVGLNRGNISNGYFAGSTNGDEDIGVVVGYNGGFIQGGTEYSIGTISNVYWDMEVNSGKNGAGEISTDADALNRVNIKGMTTDDMKSPYFVTTLNAFVDSVNITQTNFTYSKWVLDTQGANQGYPVLEPFLAP